MDYPKSVPNVGLVNGKFVDENTTTGQVGSLIPSSWGNAVTDELLNVIQAGGEQPAENDNDQLLAAIKAIVRDSIPPEKIRTTLAEYGITDAYTKSLTYTKAEVEALLKNMSALPVGAMVPFPKGTVPAGFLEVDGSEQSSAAYPDLAAYLGAAFNKGDEGAGNFRLPESRGEFLRGWDHGRGVDVGRGIASYQSSQIESHRHLNGAGSSGPGAGADPYIYGTTGEDTPGVATSRLSETAGAPNQQGYTSFTGGEETRPRNMSVMWCIKAWNAPVNQGNIDIAELAASIILATPKHYMAGFGMAPNAAAPTTTIDVAPGHARVTGNPVTLNATMSGVLQSVGAWVAGSGVNKLDFGGRTANTWYHVFIIRKLVGGDGDLLFSASLAAPAIPVGFEVIRRIGSVKTDSAGNIIPFINVGRVFWWATPIKDVLSPSTAAGTGSATLVLSTPPGVRTRVMTYVATSGIGQWTHMRPTDSTPMTMAVVTGNLGAWQGGAGANTANVDYLAFPSECITDMNSAVVLQWFFIGAAYYSVVNIGYAELY